MCPILLSDPVPSRATPAVVLPDEGQTVRAFGHEIALKLDPAQTADGLSVGLVAAPAGAPGPPLHVHHYEDELLLILEGRYRVSVGGATREAGPGSVVWLPRGVPHTWEVTGDVDGRHWAVTTSGASHRFFEAAAALGAPDFARLAVVAVENGLGLLRPAA